ncbi:MAG TPA: FAD-dependent oxidoreductase [Candidatus Eisenbacteria bacterium]
MIDQDLRAAAFPKLDKTQLAALEGCPLSKLKHCRDGEKLFEAAQRDSNFYVVKTGAVEIVDDDGDESKVVATLGPGEFTGEVGQLTGGPAIFSGIVRGESDVFEISNDALREIMNVHPDLGDVILRAFMARRHLLHEMGDFTGLRVIGSRYSRETLRVREFLAKNLVPFTWMDLEDDPQVRQFLEQAGLTEADTPVVTWGHKLLLRNPSNQELADALALRRPLEHTVYDLAVVGAGPAGLAAAVYGASEGLNTVVLERDAPGGQAGRSMRIENYLGFPTGITGRELAENAAVQANKFGAHLPVASPVTGLSFDNKYAVLHFHNGETVSAKCLLIATGADYRLLGVEGCERFEGCGVYYAATPVEAQLCKGSDVVVVGGGNSAGQATVFLSGQVRKVCLVVRGSDLYEHMSSYLAKRTEETPNVEVLLDTEVRRMSGTAASARPRSSTTGRARRGRSGPPPCSASSARRRGPTGSLRKSRRTRKDSCGPAHPWRVPRRGRHVGSPTCWRPAAPASSPLATSGPAQPSASPRPSARGRWRSCSCTHI